MSLLGVLCYPHILFLTFTAPQLLSAQLICKTFLRVLDDDTHQPNPWRMLARKLGVNYEHTIPLFLLKRILVQLRLQRVSFHNFVDDSVHIRVSFALDRDVILKRLMTKEWKLTEFLPNSITISNRNNPIQCIIHHKFVIEVRNVDFIDAPSFIRTRQHGMLMKLFSSWFVPPNKSRYISVKK